MKIYFHSWLLMELSFNLALNLFQMLNRYINKMTKLFYVISSITVCKEIGMKPNGTTNLRIKTGVLHGNIKNQILRRYEY